MKRRSPCKILIIEPSQDIQILLSEILEANDCLVDSEDKAEDGVEIAHKNQYQIIICRNSFPNSSGLLIYKELRSHLAKTGTAFFLLINPIYFQSDSNPDCLTANLKILHYFRFSIRLLF